MESIKITLPLAISPSAAKRCFEDGIQAGSNCRLFCKYIGIEDNENVYNIASEDGPQAFYYTGIIAGQLLAFIE